MSALITIGDVANVPLAITLSANAKKIAALKEANFITVVESAEDQQLAATALSNVQGILSTLEKTRKEVKAPVLELGKKIDATAEEFAKELVAEKTRLGGLIAGFQRQEMEKAERAHKAQEALEAKERARREEEARKLREEEERLRREAQATKDEDERKRLEDLAAQTQQQAEEKAAPVASAPVIAPPKAQGASARKVKVFKVTDIAALYAARPDLVELTPRTALINKEINCPDGRPLPGIEVTEEIKVAAR